MGSDRVLTRQEDPVSRTIRYVPVAAFFALLAIGASARAADNAAVPSRSLPRRERDLDTRRRDGDGPQEPPADPAVRCGRRRGGGEKGQAQSAWYPSVDLSTGYTRQRSFNATTDQNVTTPNQFAQANLNWMLYDFGRTGASVDRADANAAVIRENRRHDAGGRGLRGDGRVLQRPAERKRRWSSSGRTSGSRSRSTGRRPPSTRPASGRRSTWSGPRRTCTTRAPG